MKLGNFVLRGTSVLAIVMLLLVGLSASPAFADVAGPRNAGTAADVVGPGAILWSHPEYITTPGAPYATATVNGAQSTDYLQGTNYGFAIPDGSSITGIEVAIYRQATGGVFTDTRVSLVKGGVITGTNLASGTIWPTSFFTATYGGPTNLWGTTWTVDDINSVNFGVALAVGKTGGSPQTVSVDYMQITVHYTSVSGTTTAVNCGSGTPEVTYGSAITCVATVTSSGGTPSGTVNWGATGGTGFFDPATSCTLSGSGACSVNFTPREVGSPTISAAYAGLENNFAPSTMNQTITVNARPVTVTADPKTKVYGAADPNLTYAISGTLAFSDVFTGTLTRAPGETVGTYPIQQGSLTISPGAANYALSYVGANLRIDPVTPTLSVTNSPAVYTGSPQSATVTAYLNGTIVPGIISNVLYNNSPISPTAAGTYTVTADFAPTDTTNFNTVSGTSAGSFVIQKAAAVCSVTPYDVTYNGSPRTATGACTGVLGEALTGLSLSGTTHTNAGTYASDAWTYTDATGNYNNTSGTVSDHIARANAICPVTGYSVTYNGSAHTATGACTGVLGEALTGLNLNGTTHTNAGNYTDAWIYTDVTGNYNDGSDFVSDTIAKAAATCTVTPYDLTYDGNPHTATGSCTGVLSEALTGLNLSGTTHTNAGSYSSDAWLFTDVTGNYNNTNGLVSDHIAKAGATCTVIPYDVTYDGNPHTATGSCAGVLSEALTGLTLSGTTHTNAGTYASDAWTYTDATGNYNNANGSVTDHIGQAAPALSVTNSPVTYNGLPQAAVVTGTVSGTAGNIRYDGSATMPTNAGTYAVTAAFTPTDTLNYQILADAPAGNFVINRATPSLSVANSPVIYNGLPQAAAVVAYLNSTIVPGTASNVLYDGSPISPTAAGTYSVMATFTPTDTLNYNGLVDTPAGSFVIIQATPTLALVKTATPSTFAGVGQVITYTYVLSNTGIASLTGPFTVTDDKIASVTCPDPGSLAGGTSLTCLGSYTITAADVMAGSVANNASATATYASTSVQSNTAQAIITSHRIFLPLVLR